MSGLSLVLVLAGGAVLALAVAGARASIALLPVARSTRAALLRGLPVVAALATLVYALVAVDRLLAHHPTVAAVAMVLVLGAFVVASWNALRDIAAGVFLKAGDVCQVGDHVRLDDLHGRIQRLGLRVLVLETSDGDEALIPYSRVARDRLLRTPAFEGATPHVFRLPLEEGISPAQLKAQVRRSAMLQHWSAVSRAPEIAIEGDELEVTVYSVDPDRGPDIEAAVKLALLQAPLSAPASLERAIAEE